MRKDKEKSFSLIPIVLLSLIIVSLISGLLDAYFYNNFLASKGFSFWSFKIIHPKYFLEYVTSFPGGLLTILSASPWLFIFSLIYFHDFKKLIKRKL